MIKIIRFKHFEINATGHGGEKRTAQIDALLKGDKPVLVSDYDIQVPKRQFFSSVVKMLFPNKTERMVMRHIPASTPYLKKKLEQQRIGRLIDQLINEESFKECDLVIWENTYARNWWLPFLCNILKIPIIALPHNLESLVPQQQLNYFNKSSFWLQEEIEYLKACDYVFTISQEEEWLLKLHDVNSKYLPYYPEKELFEFLSKIREIRTTNVQKDNTRFLILGTVGNQPAYLGMNELLKELSKNCYSKYNFDVCGYGTEVFKKEKYPDYIKIHGSLGNEALMDLTIKTAAIIIKQKASSGALTKIVEFLISGVPVICDNISARSQRQYKGVFCYEEFKDLEELLSDFNSQKKNIPPVPAYPIKEMGLFRNVVK